MKLAGSRPICSMEDPGAASRHPATFREDPAAGREHPGGSMDATLAAKEDHAPAGMAPPASGSTPAPLRNRARFPPSARALANRVAAC